MRLFLSSYRLGNHGESLAELIGKPSPEVGIIMNAGDLHTPEEQEERFGFDAEMFKPYGFNLSRIDLRQYFNKQRDVKQALVGKDALWVRGGNTFILRRAMRASGFDEAIKEMLTKDKLVYAGYSAGAIVMTKTLSGIELVDDSSVIPRGYDKKVIWDGLGLINYSLAPHYDSDHPESEAVNHTIAYFESNMMPYMTLRDGEVIIINGDKEEFLK